MEAIVGGFYANGGGYPFVSQPGGNRAFFQRHIVRGRDECGQFLVVPLRQQLVKGSFDPGRASFLAKIVEYEHWSFRGPGKLRYEIGAAAGGEG